MNEQNQSLAYSPTQERHSWITGFHAKVGRYRYLLTKWWWIAVVFGCLGSGGMLYRAKQTPPAYASTGRMIVSVKMINMPGEAVYKDEEFGDFLGTQAALMQSSNVVRNAHELLRMQTNLVPCPVQLTVNIQPKTTIFQLRVVADNPGYAEAFLQACMDEYVKLKKEIRAQKSDTTLANITAEVIRLENELKKCDNEIVAFASSNSVVVLQDQGKEQGNNASAFLATLNQRLATLKYEYELLRSLTSNQKMQEKETTSGTTLMEAANFDSARSSMAGSDNNITKTKQSITMLKAELKELSTFLRPQHPKVITMSEDIARQERLLEVYRTQNKEEMEMKAAALELEIKELEKEVKDWTARVLELNRTTVEYQRLKANSQRVQAFYDRLLAAMQSIDVNKEITTENVTILEKASKATVILANIPKSLLIGLMIGLAISAGLFMLIDRLDDRLNSLTELTQIFHESVLGQIPQEKSSEKGKDIQLLKPDDERHGFQEAFRSIRSSLLYMSESGKAPRMIVVTSSVPNDGKSVTASNLAITMAGSGSRVLLVDADLRKGELHGRFGLMAQPGLSEILTDDTPWTEVIQPTSVPNLSFISRGATTMKSSELFLGSAAQKFLKDMSMNFDYVILDTAPVMAVDDVPTLAPHVDGVVFVIRAQKTSARVARTSLDIIRKRRATILGLVFNAVSQSSGDYYYYYKYKDYYYYRHAKKKDSKTDKSS